MSELTKDFIQAYLDCETNEQRECLLRAELERRVAQRMAEARMEIVNTFWEGSEESKPSGVIMNVKLP